MKQVKKKMYTLEQRKIPAKNMFLEECTVSNKVLEVVSFPGIEEAF